MGTDGRSGGLHAGLEAGREFLRSWQALDRWVPREELGDVGGLPEILDFADSVIELSGDDSVSVARLGDGELGLATGATVPNNGCQAADPELREALQRVLRCDNPKCRVALPKSFFFRDPTCTSEEVDSFVRDAFAPQYKAGDYGKYIVRGYRYLDASMSVVRRHYPDLGRRVYDAYYAIVRGMLHGRDVMVVSGDSRFLEYENSLLGDSGARSVLPLVVPQRDAWGLYKAIKKRIMDLNESGDRLVLLGCGPTATVLAYELSDRMRCLDVGHMFGDYNLAMGGAGIGAFWA